MLSEKYFACRLTNTVSQIVHTVCTYSHTITCSEVNLKSGTASILSQEKDAKMCPKKCRLVNSSLKPFTLIKGYEYQNPFDMQKNLCNCASIAHASPSACLQIKSVLLSGLYKLVAIHYVWTYYGAAAILICGRLCIYTRTLAYFRGDPIGLYGQQWAVSYTHLTLPTTPYV